MEPKQKSTISTSIVKDVLANNEDASANLGSFMRGVVGVLTTDERS